MKRYLCAIGILLICSLALAAEGDLDKGIKQGIELFDKGKYGEALNVYLEIYKNYPTHPTLLYEIGYTYYVLKDYKKAEEFAMKARVAGYSGFDLFILLGSIYDDTNEIDKAIEFYKQACDAKLDHYLAYYNLGIAYFKKNQYKEAEEAFQKAIKLNDKHASSYYGLGNVYATQGETYKANDIFDKFLKIEKIPNAQNK